MEGVGDFNQTDIGPGEEANDAEHDEQQILVQSPVKRADWFVPERNNLDDCRKHESKRAQTNSSNQRYKRSQIGHSGCQQNSQDLRIEADN